MEALVKNKFKTQGIMVVFFLIMIFPFLLVSIWSYQYIRHDAETAFNNNLMRFTHNTALESVSRPLEEIGLIFEIVASRITPKDLDDYIAPQVSFLNATVASMVNSFKFFDNALLADANGNVKVYPEMDLTDFILHEREWYKDALYKTDIEYSTAYQTQWNSDNKTKTIITVSMNLYDDDLHKFGNIAFDLNLESMSTILQDVVVPNNGRFLVVSREGDIVMSQVARDLFNKKVPTSWIERAIEQQGNFYDPQTESFVFYRIYNNPDWVAFTVVDKASHAMFATKAQNMLGWVILVSLVIYAIAICLCRIYIREIINRLYISVNGIACEDGQSSLERIYYSIKNSRDELKHSHEELNEVKRISCEDPLTGIGTRRKLDEEMEALINNNTPFYFAIIDLDNFKSINDTFGHSVGDRVLKYTSKTGKAIMEPDYKLYRFGGEELVVIFPGVDYDSYYELMETWRDTVHQRNWREMELNVSFSGGMAAWKEGDGMSDILKRADDLLYAAKRSGKNVVMGTPP
ncbi:MAG: sensor domain-containing diguanylate cyclase [Silvania sp.]|uniref:sensor domain-containing diguanylate cyclase n=1 Tax=Silvania sp. TaxID=3016633 RepID=UPI003EE745DF